MTRPCLLRLLLVLPLLWAGTQQACADDISELLPRKCVRVTSVDELSEQAYYAFAAVGYKDSLYLLSAETQGTSSSSKLKATSSGGGLENVIEVSSVQNLWTLQRSGKEGEENVYSILSAAGNGSVYVPDIKKTNLTVSTSKSTPWSYTSSDDGVFSLTTSGADRYLGIYAKGTAEYNFGFYKNTGGNLCDIYIYKLVTSFEELPGEAAAPVDGTAIAISAEDKTMADDMTVANTEGLLLANGLLAPDESLSVLTAHVENDGTFSLTFSDNTFLGYDLNAKSEAALWHIENGHVATAETPVRYFVYLPKSEIFTTLAADEAFSQDATSVCFQTLEAAADSAVSADGVLHLSGGWSAQKLSGIDLSKYSGVSLLDISLPLVNKSFMDDGKNNAIIYVDASAAQYVPDSWRFVVSVDGNTASLLREVTLVDRQPLYVAHSFKAQKGQIGYTRQCATDGNWETLCLPFAASVPSGYDVEMLTVVNQDELTFSKTSKLSAQQPVIFRKTTSDASPLTLTNSDEVTISSGSAPTVMNVYFGNYDALSVASAADNIYLLAADGNYFLHAAAGSTLDAFRAYLKMNGKGSAVRIKYDTSDVRSVLSDCSENRCYDLAGRRLTKNKNKGIYILNNKKLIK